MRLNAAVVTAAVWPRRTARMFAPARLARRTSCACSVGAAPTALAARARLSCGSLSSAALALSTNSRERAACRALRALMNRTGTLLRRARGRSRPDRSRRPPALAAASLALSPARTPGEDRAGESVVVDLVGALADVPQDARVAGKPSEDGVEPLTRNLGEVGQVARAVGDLRPRRGDHVLEGAGGDVWSPRGTRPSSLQLRGDNAPSTSEPLQRLQPQHSRPCALFLGPETIQHELEIGRLDARFVAPATVPTPVPAPSDEATFPVSTWVSKASTSAGSIVSLLPRLGGAVPLLQRAHDRFVPAPAVEMIDAEVVREQARDPSCEAVEPRQRVLPERDQEVHPQVRIVDDSGNSFANALLTVLIGVVEEVVLEPVEHDQEGAHPLRPGPQRLHQRRAGRPRGELLTAARLRGGGVQRLYEPGQRILSPGSERADCERRASPQRRWYALARAGRAGHLLAGERSFRLRSGRRGW